LVWDIHCALVSFLPFARLLKAELRTGTQDVAIYPLRYRENQTIYLVDTPGFNDTTRSDTEVLTDIAYFLGATYSKDIMLAGIIYLHRIIDPRMGGNALKNLHMFKALCGTTSLSNVVLATTMWDTLQDPAAKLKGERIEQELRKTPDFWGDMVDMGSTMLRHSGTRDTALKIVDHIMRLEGHVVLDIQRQMVDNKQTLNDTPAGQEVQKEILKAKAKFQEEIEATKQAMQAAIEEGNQRMADKLARIQEDNQRKIDLANQQTIKLQDNFERIKREGDAKAERMIKELREENQRYSEQAAAQQREVNQLAAQHRKHEAELAKERLEYSRSTKEWEERLRRRDAEDARRKEEYIRKRHERNQLLAKSQRNKEKMKIFKVVTGAVMAVGGVVTANPALMTSGAAMAINGGASGTGNVLKSEDYYDISYGTDYDQGNMLPACDDAGCDVVDVG